MTKKMSFLDQVGTLPANFWYANLMEIFERLAYFGVRAIIPLYLVASSGENGLGLSFGQKGTIYAVWALLQCLIPMVSGGYTERYGYRKSLVVAFVINIAGYLAMAQSKPLSDYLVAAGWSGAGYWVFLVSARMVGTGTAIFKPPCHGTIAKATSEETSSMGWGLFYCVVNIGGTLAPMGAALLRGEVRWHWVFYAAAVVTALNFLPAFLLFKEPEKEPSKAGENAENKGPFEVFADSITTAFSDGRLVVFLLIFSCFWLMFMQLWDLLPNFIDEWVDTSDVSPIFGWLSSGWVLENGQTKPEMIINIDSLAIILLVVPISWVVRKMNKIAAMIAGMLISLVGFVATGSTTVGVICCIAVFVFAIGEMMCSPTFSAYIGLIAPPDKKALYMGYSNIPYAIGWAVGNGLSGYLYESMASKYSLARQYLSEKLGMSAELVNNADLLPKERVMETMARVMETGTGQSIEATFKESHAAIDWSSMAPDVANGKLVELWDKALGVDSAIPVDKATQVLWDLHHPYVVWYYLGIFGVVGTVGMIVFYLVTKKDSENSESIAGA